VTLDKKLAFDGWLEGLVVGTRVDFDEKVS
jgi:hypothetical protein